MVRISHIHASGRFNQPVPEFAQGLVGYRKIASVITVTEVDNNARARLLKGNGWDGVWGDRSPRDDCGITWDEHWWTKVWAGTVDVSQSRYVNERHNLAGVTAAAYAVLRHNASGAVVVFGSLHTPHGMQDELRRNKVTSDVGRAYVAITSAFQHHANRLARQHKASAVSLSGDWNLNVRLAWANVWLKTYASAGGYKLNWTGRLPARGTHGKEIIDATLYKGMVLQGTPAVLTQNKGDDHVAFRETFSL